MLKTIRANLNRLGIGRKFELFLILLFCVLALMALFAARYILMSYERSIYVLNADNVNRFAYLIDSYLNNIDDFGNYLIGNGSIQNLLSRFADTSEMAEASLARRNLFRELNSLSGTTPYVQDIALVLPSGEVVHSGNGYAEDKEFQEKAIGMASEAEGRPVWIMDEENTVYYVREVRRLEYLKLDSLACLFFKVNLKGMIEDVRKSERNMRGLYLSNFLTILYGEDGEIYSSEIELSENESEFLTPVLSGEEAFIVGNIADGTYLVSSGKLERTGWQLLSLFDCAQLTRGIKTGLYVVALLLVLLLFLSCFLIRLMAKHLINHFVTLKDKMVAFSGGQDLSSFPSYEDRRDEIGTLHQEFDRMVERFDVLIKDNYLKQIMIKDNKIKMLNQQINPHFLYNVLDSIYWSAMSSGAEDIAKMSYSLARLFRIATSDDSVVVPLSREIEYLELYLDIQNVRFPNMISFSKDVEPDVLDALVPRLSVQPLVENAIKHSSADGEETDIILCACRAGDFVTVSVSNTGTQFPPDIEKRLEGEKESESHIGLRNINERLHLIFGPSANLSFSNEANHAVVRFSIPYTREGFDA